MAKDARRHKYSGKQIYTDNQKKDGLASVLSRKERALKNSDGRKTNASFAATDTEFKEACARAKVEPTARQASKWFRKTGLAYKEGAELSLIKPDPHMKIDIACIKVK